MTKQEAIDKAWVLLEILEAMPDGVDIMIAEARECSGPDSFNVHLNSGIELVSRSLVLPISARTPENSEYIHREIKAKNCEYVQLEKAAPGVTSTESGGAE